MTRLLLALALTLLTTTTAHAQLTRDSVGAGRGALDGQLTWGANYRPGFGHVPESHAFFVTVQFRLVQQVATLAPDLALEFDLDGAIGTAVYTSTGWLGSPWIGLSLASRTESQTLRVSLGVAPPVASIRSTLHGAEDLFPSGWSGWNDWLAARPVIPLGLQSLAEWRFTNLDAGADLALIAGPTFSAEGAPVSDLSFAAWAAFGTWLTGHLSREFDLGARLQAVGRFMRRNPSMMGPGGDSTQLHASLTPFVRYAFTQSPSPSPSPAFIEYRLNFNFLAPYGPVFFAESFTWSMALAMGTTW